MRNALILIAVLMTACPSSEPDDLAECVPPTIEAVEADGPWDGVLLEVRVASSEWSPHMLWLDVWDTIADARPEGIEQPGADGWSRSSLWIAESAGTDLEITVTDPRGCDVEETVTISL